MTTAAFSLTTVEQVLENPPRGSWEIVDGELIEMSPAGIEHGRISMNLAYLLRRWLEDHPVGVVYAAETGFMLQRSPDRLRAPDVAFVCRERSPEVTPTGFFNGPPDFAAEVISPNERPSVVEQKVGHWLEAGCREVWVVWPTTRSVTVHRPGLKQPLLYHEGDRITAEGAPEGFAIEVSKVFA
jgi:Uma2 family endonuclease